MTLLVLGRSFGSWKTAWKRRHRFSEDGTWDAIHAALLRDADAVTGGGAGP